MTTVAKLHKLLGALINAGHGRKEVLVNKDSFRHPLEQDGAVLLPIEGVDGPRWIPMIDDDGGTKWSKYGAESGKIVVVIRGGTDGGDGGEGRP